MGKARLKSEYVNRKASLPCWTLCGVFALILGFLPALSGSITQVLRPIFILICLVFTGRYYRLHSEKWQIVLLAYWFITLMLNPLTASAIRSYIALLLFGFFFVFAASRVWTAKEIRLIINTVAFATLFFSIVLIFSNEGIINKGDGVHISFFSFVCNRNSAAFGCVPGVLCAELGLLYGKGKKARRLIYLITTIIGLYVIFGLACRSAFVSVAVGAVLIMWQTTIDKGDYRKRFTSRATIITIFMIAFVSAYFLAQGTSSERLFDMDDDSGRSTLWDKAWELIDEKPILGGGFDYWSENSGEELGTHNTLLTIMVMSGYIGGILFLIFMVAALLDLLKARNLIPLAFLGELAMHSYTESGMDYYAYIPLIISFIIGRYLTYNTKKFKSVFKL